MSADLSLFLGQLLRRPHEVVALAPSSEGLARAMAAQVPNGQGPVMELGAGTGKITRALLESGVAPQDLHAIELQNEFVLHLRSNLPDVHVHHGKAQEIARFAPCPAKAVVSGLPLLSMPNTVQEEILTGVRQVLQPGGSFIQFTYGPTPPVAECLRQAFGLSWTKGKRIWNNLPPARVYAFRFAGH